MRRVEEEDIRKSCVLFITAVRGRTRGLSNTLVILRKHLSWVRERVFVGDTRTLYKRIIRAKKILYSIVRSTKITILSFAWLLYKKCICNVEIDFEVEVKCGWIVIYIFKLTESFVLHKGGKKKFFFWDFGMQINEN